MKKLFTYVWLMFCATMFAQNRAVNVDDPISDVDITYTSDGTARLTVTLNTIEGSNTGATGPVDYTAEMNIENGTIFWQGIQTDSQKKILLNTSLKKIGKDKPFVLYADLYDGNNNTLKKPSDQNKWTKVSFKLNYMIGGKSGQRHIFNFYAPPGEEDLTEKLIVTSTTAYLKDVRKGVINFKSQPSGMPFEILDITITKIMADGTKLSDPISTNELGTNRFTYNGSLNLEINPNFDIELSNSKYLITCNAIVLGTKNKLKSTETEIVFVPDYEFQIINRQPDYSIALLSQADNFDDINIETKGSGTLGIRFLNPQYKDVKSSTVSLPNSRYIIRLENCKSVPNETSSTFFYTNGTKDISPPLMITKKLPRVTDFKFNGVDEKALYMSFKLPGIDEGQSPTITFSTSTGEIQLGGNLIIKQSSTDKTLFDVKIDKKIANVFTGGEIVKDVSIAVKYAGNILYSMTVTVYDQKLHKEKTDALKVEVEKKKNKRDGAKIDGLVNDLQKYAKAVGNDITDVEASKIKQDLKEAKTEDTVEIINAVGKWVLAAGKIVLPLLV